MSLNTEDLAREYGPVISTLCRRMIRNRDEAEEAAQEIWIEILKSLPGFKNQSSPGTWIYTIARRKILQLSKKERIYNTRNLSLYFRQQEQYGIPEMMEIPSEDHELWIKTNCSDCINAMLHCLDQTSLLVYLFRLFTPLKYKELSEVFKQSEEALRKIYSRSSRKISRFLSGNCFLFNPEGTCRCKMKGPLKRTALPELNREIGQITKAVSFIKTMDDITALKKNIIFS